MLVLWAYAAEVMAPQLFSVFICFLCQRQANLEQSSFWDRKFDFVYNAIIRDTSHRHNRPHQNSGVLELVLTETLVQFQTLQHDPNPSLHFVAVIILSVLL